ncbi:MAG: patatin-like phospholipase family protein [Nanoarchaeota archaeon]
MVKKIKNKKGITLVLGGGGARGLAHIGVLEVLNENKIPIDAIVGTSAGALVGGCYCAGKLGLLKEIVLNFEGWNIVNLFFSPDTRDVFLHMSKFDDLFNGFLGKTKIENMKIHFIAVSYDIKKDKIKISDKGKLADAIRSSISIPGVFKPFNQGNSSLVDGGIVDIVPVDIAKKRFPDARIVAVNVDAGLKIDGNRSKSALGVGTNSLIVQIRELSMLQENGAKVIVHPKVGLNDFQFNHAKKAIAIGRRSAKKALKDIKKLLKN